MSSKAKLQRPRGSAYCVHKFGTLRKTGLQDWAEDAEADIPAVGEPRVVSERLHALGTALWCTSSLEKIH